MKDPLTLLTELFGSALPIIPEAATLEFCYDHITDDYAGTLLCACQLTSAADSPTQEIEETE